MKQIIIYPGKFQPFSPHHNAVYQHLTKQFPDGDVYIITSNKTTTEFPFTFNDKKLIAIQFGIPSHRIINERNPYSPEFIKHFDLSTIELICAYSDKDMGRISYIKKDGSPGYYQPITDDKLSADKHGYIYIVPKISINYKGNELSGTYVRNFLKYCDHRQFAELFGWYNQNVYQLVKNKILGNVANEIMAGNTPNGLMDRLLEGIVNTNSKINVDRKDMPQIDDVNDLTSWLSNETISYKSKDFRLDDLKITQSTVDDEKINNLLNNVTKRVAFLIISSDLYILDGHHRFIAAKLSGQDICRCIIIDLPVIEAINKLKEYPNIKHKNIK